MTAAALLTDLLSRGARLEARDDRLRCEGPPDVLTPEALALLRERKPDLLRLLAHGAPVPVEWHGLGLWSWPDSDLLLRPGEAPRWCACCGVELLDLRRARCAWCARREYQPGEDLFLDDDWRKPT